MEEKILFQNKQITIYDKCYHDEPCYHHAIIDGKDDIYDSPYIYYVIKERNLPVSQEILDHFEYEECEDAIRQYHSDLFSWF